MTDGLVRTIPSATVTAIADGGAVETVVITSRPIRTDGPGRTLTLFGEVNITTGTAGTAVVLTFRRGSTTAGAVVGTATTDTTTAATEHSIPFEFTDAPGDVDGIVYSVTVTETSATADGTVNHATIGGYIS